MNSLDIPIIKLQCYKESVTVTDETTWRNTFRVKENNVAKCLQCMNTNIYVHVSRTIFCASASSNYITICTNQTCEGKSNSNRINTPYDYHIHYSNHALNVGNDSRTHYLYFLP